MTVTHSMPRAAERISGPRRVLVMTVVHNPLDSRVWFRQVDALLSSGWHVTYAAPFTGYGQPLHSRVPGLPGSLTCIDIPRAEGLKRGRANWAARQVLKRLAPGHDLVLVHDPELVVAAAGLRLPNLVWDVHEDLSAALQVKEWMPRNIRPAVAGLWQRVERRIEQAHQLLLAEFEYQRRFRRNHPVVPNTVVVPSETLPPGRDRLVYLGTVTEARGCSMMIEVARELGALPGAPVQLEVIGDAPERRSAEALRQAEREGVLTWRGFLPSDEALAHVSGALAGLSLLDDLPNFHCSLPTKVVEYAAHGVPVITTPLPIAEQLVRRAHCGLVVPWRNPQAVVSAVIALREDPNRAALLGRNGHLMALEQFDWRILSERFVRQMDLMASRAEPAEPSRPAVSHARHGAG